MNPVRDGVLVGAPEKSRSSDLLIRSPELASGTGLVGVAWCCREWPGDARVPVGYTGWLRLNATSGGVGSRTFRTRPLSLCERAGIFIIRGSRYPCPYRLWSRRVTTQEQPPSSKNTAGDRLAWTPSSVDLQRGVMPLRPQRVGLATTVVSQLCERSASGGQRRGQCTRAKQSGQCE
jgi:hypothetical protein